MSTARTLGRRWRVIEQLGEGGMAEVFLVEELAATIARKVVIKRIRKELLADERFAGHLAIEAELASRLRHPNIVKVHELASVDGEPLLVLEHVAGVDLARLLAACVSTGKAVSAAVVAHIGCEVAAALDHAHTLRGDDGSLLGMVHRDVTPANVMLTWQGAVKLLDFGIAKAADRLGDDATRTAAVRGTLGYLAPEQAEGLAIDTRVDLFSLGVVLWEALCGRRLWRGEDDFATLRLVRLAEVPPPSTLRSDIPPALERVVLRLLARDPQQRTATAKEALSELRPIAHALSGDRAAAVELLSSLQTALSTKPKLPSLNSARRRRWPWALTAGLAATSVAALWHDWRPRSDVALGPVPQSAALAKPTLEAPAAPVPRMAAPLPEVVRAPDKLRSRVARPKSPIKDPFAKPTVKDPFAGAAKP